MPECFQLVVYILCGLHILEILWSKSNFKLHKNDDGVFALKL